MISGAIARYKVCLICQRYKFKSKSQHIAYHGAVLRECV